MSFLLSGKFYSTDENFNRRGGNSVTGAKTLGSKRSVCTIPGISPCVWFIVLVCMDLYVCACRGEMGMADLSVEDIPQSFSGLTHFLGGRRS